jgi:FlaG/FlaF family flagellin (archaellin)
VETILGLLGVLVFIACTIILAAAITWVVVRVTPAEKPKPEQPAA